jgi:hypothetical protein
MSSHWRITLLNTHVARPLGVPGAFVITKPPLIVRLIRVRCPVIKIEPFVPMDGFEFVTHPFSEHAANVDRPAMFSVPLTVVPLAWMTPVSVEETLETPPPTQFVCCVNDSLNCVEHDVPDGLHCTVMDRGPARKPPVRPSSERVNDLEPALVAFIDAITPETTVLIAL